MVFNDVNSVEYGDVVLSIVDTVTYSKKPVYDQSGVDFLYVEHYLKVHCIYNPSATSYRIEAGTPVERTGRTAPQTEEALRSHLEKPRLKLRYRIGGTVVLESPTNQNVVDAHIGPIPGQCEVEKIHGGRTFTVTWEVRTWVSEKSVFEPNESENVLISNRWTASHHIEGEVGKFAEAITRQGTAVFNVERLLTLGELPDNYRTWLIPLPPPRFRRSNLDITVSPDGSTVHYSYTDLRRRLALKQSGITNVECTHQIGVTAPSYTEAWVNSITMPIGAITSAMAGSNRPTSTQTMGSTISMIPNMISANSPTKYYTVMTRVYGHDNVPISFLSMWARRIMAHRFRINGITLDNTAFRHYQVRYSETHDVANGIVEINCTLASGITIQVQTQFGFPDPPVGNDIHPEVAAFTNSQPVAGASTPFNHNGTRGNYPGAVVAQILQDAFEKPSTPLGNIPNATEAGTPY